MGGGPELKICFGEQAEDLVLCPTARRLERRTVFSDGRAAIGSTFTAGWRVDANGKVWAGSYSFNGSTETIGGNPGWDDSSYLYRTLNPNGGDWSDATKGGIRPSIPVMLDGRVPGSFGQAAEFGPPPYENEWPVTQSTHWSYTCINRHNGGVSSLFLDWSVRKVGLKELWTIKWSRDFNIHGPWTKAGGAHPEDWPAWMRRFKDY